MYFHIKKLIKSRIDIYDQKPVVGCAVVVDVVGDDVVVVGSKSKKNHCKWLNMDISSCDR